MNYRTLPLLCVALLGPLLLAAQHDRMSFVNFSARSALGSGAVNDLARDTTGYLWIATNAGVRRYDGYRFRSYQAAPDRPDGLADNVVTCVLVDRQNRKWFGTREGGIARLDETTGTFVTYRDGLRGVGDLAEDHAGRLLAATTAGLYAYDPAADRWTTLPQTLGWGLTAGFDPTSLHDALPTDRAADFATWADRLFPDTTYARRALATAVGKFAGNSLWPRLRPQLVRETPRDGMGPAYANLTALTVDAHDNLFLGYYHGGVGYLAAGATTPTVLRANGNPARTEGMNKVNDLLLRHDTLLVARLTDGVTGLNVTSGRAVALPYALPAVAVQQLALRNDRLYAATALGVLVRDLTTGRAVGYDGSGNFEHGLVAAETACVLPDDDVLWIGHSRHGLSRGVTATPIFVHPQPDQPPLPHYMRGVTAAHQDARGRLWLGYYEGGIRWVGADDFSTRNTYLTDDDNGIERSSVFTLFSDREGTLWGGGYRTGLIRYDAARDDWFPATTNDQDPLRGSDVRAIGQDRSGYLWVALHAHGMIRYDPATGDRLSFTPANDLLPSSYPFDLVVDERDRVWVATVNGLFLIEADRQQVRAVIPPANDRQRGYHHRVFDLEPFAGGMSAATQDGLLLFDAAGERLPRPLPAELTGAPLQTLVADPSLPGLWVTTEHDLYFYRPDQNLLLRYQPPTAGRAAGFTRNAGLVTADRRLLFGTSAGLIGFAPHQLRRPVTVGTATVTGTEYFDATEVPPADGRPLLLPPDNAGFALDFSSFNYDRPAAARFEVRLAPHQREWSALPAGNPRFVVHHLSPGDYRVEYRVRSEQGLSAGPVRQLPVQVASPWYATYWAWVGYFLVVCALLAGYLWLMRRRDALRQRVRYERMEAAKTRELAAEKTRFFENVSHDLRTPLTLIDTPLDALLRQPELPLPTRRRYYEIMRRNSERLDRLIRHLLNFRQLEDGPLLDATETGDLVDYLRRLAEPFALRARQQRINLTLTLPAAPVRTVFPAEALNRIVENLLSNALKFTPAGGRVDLTLRVAAHRPEGMTLIVADTGPGVPEADTERIFERFYRQPGQEHTEGTGIGLAVVRELADRLGGSIRCRSRAGAGTVFTCALPLESEETATATPHAPRETATAAAIVSGLATPPKEPATPDDPERPHLLVVDDDPDIRATIRNGAGDRYRITEAADGATALRLAGERQPDLIISDVMMPELDGNQFCAALKADPATSHLPVLLLTARHGEDARREGLAAGANGYLTKPFKLHLLFRQVDNTLTTLRAARRHWVETPRSTLPAALLVTAADRAFLTTLREHVNERMAEGTIDHQQLFRAVAMSRTLCFAKVKALTGLSLGAYIKRLKIDRARSLLRGTPGITLAEVAFQSGFKTTAHFARTFKAVQGETPGQFRAVRRAADSTE